MDSSQGQQEFHWKQRHGKPVGRREMAEKHYRSESRTCYKAQANPRVEDCLNIPPARPRGILGRFRGFPVLGKKFERGIDAEIEEGLRFHSDD